MIEVDIARLMQLESQFVRLPTVVTYSRLEPLNLSSGDLAPGLEARIADPLWLIGRQWQFEELRGEDAGSPVVARISAERAQISRFHPGRVTGPTADPDPAATAADVPGRAKPLEVAVEAEAPVQLPERVRAALGLHLVRLTRAAELPRGVLAKVIAAYAATWPFTSAIDPVEAEVDRAGVRRRRVVQGRVPDGATALTDLAGRRGAGGSVTSLPSGVGAAAGTQARRATVRRVCAAWLEFAEGYVAAPVGSSWDPSRMEYSFAVQASLPSGAVTLEAAEYAGGTVDWHTFDATDGPGLGAPASPSEDMLVEEKLHPEFVEEAMPTPVRYPGMPSERLWAFEDAAVDLGGLRAGSTDLARLALVEFALAYGNDWFLAPFRLAYGDVARVRSLHVVDTFEVDSEVRPSREIRPPGRDGVREGWTAFQHTHVDDDSPRADLFVLPATVRHALHGPPLEEVALIRDEMANIVWGVERIVQGKSGEPVRRGLLEGRAVRQQLPDDIGDAQIVYRLMTPVPGHWVPFVAVPAKAAGSDRLGVELERRPMVRFLADGAQKVVHPEGILLRADPRGDLESDRLRIAEEEVPREGVIVTRRFELARTVEGRSVLWIGRHKQVGSGEGSSGLKFDIAVPPAVS